MGPVLATEDEALRINRHLLEHGNQAFSAYARAAIFEKMERENDGSALPVPEPAYSYHRGA